MRASIGPGLGLALALTLMSCADSDSRRVMEVQSVSPDGRTLIVTVDSCGGNPNVLAEESDDRVVLTATGGDTGDDCLDGGEVTLAEPLGDREIVGLAPDQPVRNVGS